MDILGAIHMGKEITFKKYIEIAKTIREVYEKTSIILSIA